MFKRLFIPAFILAVAAFRLPARAADVLDRIVATVNGHIILQSDWEDEINYEAFANGRSLSALTLADRKAALDRLIDQELLREQIRNGNLEHASAEVVIKRVAEIRRQNGDVQSDEDWHALLRRYFLTEASLESRVQTELDLMRLVENRLRPTVNVDAKSIEDYYSQELLPQLRQSGSQDVSLIEVTPKIKELLTQLKMNQLLAQWLQSLRAGSEIHNGAFEAGAGGEAQ
jgi:peptidyl-prolyl cis-trans isomerase SurA